MAGDAAARPRPGAVLFPAARGPGRGRKGLCPTARRRRPCRLVADLYGNAAFVEDLPEAMGLMNELRGDVMRWRQRAQVALEALARQAGVDQRKLAAIGYCFGGSTALELAHSGAALGAAVSFHGALASPRLDDVANIRARVLVCHGTADPLVPPEQVAAFVAAMCKAPVDWQLHSYAGVVHGFTNPEADNAGTPALAFNAAADQRSWQSMLELFREIF